MAKCKTCGSSEFRKEIIPRHQDNLMGGIPVVVIAGVEQEICAVCGEVRGIKIPNLGGLVAAVAVKRATLPARLSGKEIRFMRKALGWKAKELADKLEVAPESVSRWESAAQPMSIQLERYLRLVVCNLLHEQAPAIRFTPETIVNLQMKIVLRSAANDSKDDTPKPLVFRLVKAEEFDCGKPQEPQWEPEAKAA